MKTTNKVVLGFIITGLCLVIFGLCLGGYYQMENIYHEDGNFWGWRSYATMHVKEEFVDIHNLDIETAATKVIIEEYSGSSIKVEAKYISKKTKIENENGTLKIEGTENNWFIGFNFFNDTSAITIYVPRDLQFNHVSLHVDAGKISFDKIVAKTLDVDVAAGKVSGDKAIATKSKFEVGAGKITLDYVDSQDLAFDVAVGKITATVAGDDEDYRYKANCNAGSLTIGESSIDGFSGKQAGGYGERSIEANCDAGKITIEMEG